MENQMERRKVQPTEPWTEPGMAHLMGQPMVNQLTAFDEQKSLDGEHSLQSVLMMLFASDGSSLQPKPEQLKRRGLAI